MTAAQLLERLRARVAPARPYLVRARTTCDRCRQPFETDLAFATSSTLQPATVVEPLSTVCPRCASGARR